ncbi:MAG: GerMN domain-containing protein [Nitrospirae bacterium]|nr:GerMN domain-containing protein [Nitrospirota bacterium]
MRKGSKLLIILLVLVSLAGVGFGVFYFYFYEPATEPVPVREDISDSILKEYTTLKIFYPAGSRLELVEKKVPGILSSIKMAEILIQEYLSLSGEAGTGLLPEGTRVNGIFISSDGIVYLDFNREFSRNFQGDVFDEYMLLKSIFNTMLGNLDVRDVMILINGKETETMGGHLMINRPLKEIVTREIRVEE